jgi:hypothetical protein
MGATTAVPPCSDVGEICARRAKLPFYASQRPFALGNLLVQ